MYKKYMGTTESTGCSDKELFLSPNHKVVKAFIDNKHNELTPLIKTEIKPVKPEMLCQTTNLASSIRFREFEAGFCLIR